MTRTAIAISSIGLVWVCSLAFYFYTPASPYIPLGGDTVTPSATRAEGVVTLLRNFEVTRRADIQITRQLIRGTCPRDCEAVDMPTSYLTIEPGTYARKRDLIIPRTAHAGKWQFHFHVRWDDHFGRTFSIALPVLDVEVIP